MNEQIKYWARQLRAIAQTGLEYGKDVYDKERYHELNTLSNDMLAYISGIHPQQISHMLPIETGYATPKIAVRGLIFHEEKILMVKESLDGYWSLPGGWCDIGLSLSENIEKEVQEETGLESKAVRLLAAFDQTKYRPSVTLQQIYTVYFLCKVIGGKLQSSIETTKVKYFNTNDLPPLSKERLTTKQLMKAISIATTIDSQAYFD